MLPRGRPARHASADAAGDASWTGQLPDNKRRGAFWLLALWTSVEALVVWGFNMQAVNVFMALGLGQAAAIGAWMLSGPSQALIRTGELISGSRYSIFAVGLISAVLAPIGLTIFLATGATAGTAAMLAILFGSGLGLYSIARQVIPLRLFGIAEFGSISGRLTLPQNVATAIAPLLFAAVLSHAGPLVAVALALVFSCIALCALIALIRLAQGSSGPTSDG